VTAEQNQRLKINFCRVAAHVAATCHDVEGTGLIAVGALQRVAAWRADRRVGYPPGMRSSPSLRRRRWSRAHEADQDLPGGRAPIAMSRPKSPLAVPNSFTRAPPCRHRHSHRLRASKDDRIRSGTGWHLRRSGRCVTPRSTTDRLTRLIFQPGPSRQAPVVRLTTAVGQIASTSRSTSTSSTQRSMLISRGIARRSPCPTGACLSQSLECLPETGSANGPVRLIGQIFPQSRFQSGHTRSTAKPLRRSHTGPFAGMRAGLRWPPTGRSRPIRSAAFSYDGLLAQPHSAACRAA
jgi:hypothetical protein